MLYMYAWLLSSDAKFSKYKCTNAYFDWCLETMMMYIMVCIDVIKYKGHSGCVDMMLVVLESLIQCLCQ